VADQRLAVCTANTQAFNPAAAGTRRRQPNKQTNPKKQTNPNKQTNKQTNKQPREQKKRVGAQPRPRQGKPRLLTRSGESYSPAPAQMWQR
jgi:hypothetical protein